MKNTTLAIIIVLGIAVGVTAYRYIMDEDETPQKTFAVTAVIGALVAVIALYAFSTGRPKISPRAVRSRRAPAATNPGGANRPDARRVGGVRCKFPM